MTTLDRLEALEKEATKGPWESVSDGRRVRMWLDSGEGESFTFFAHSEGNAALIAALRNAAPALIAAARGLAEIHEYHCGCDQPGRLDLCVAKPTLSFAALARLTPEAPDA